VSESDPEGQAHSSPRASDGLEGASPFQSGHLPGVGRPKKAERSFAHCGSFARSGLLASLPKQGRQLPRAVHKRRSASGVPAAPRHPPRCRSAFGRWAEALHQAVRSRRSMRGHTRFSAGAVLSVGPEGLGKLPGAEAREEPALRTVFPSGPKAFRSPCAAEALQGRHAPWSTEVAQAREPPRRIRGSVLGHPGTRCR
jgi:hypothetical protein